MKVKQSKVLIVLSLLFAIIMILVSIITFGDAVSASADSDTGKTTEVSSDSEDSVVVASYKDVFRYYYEIVLEASKKANKSNVCSFDEFCDKYYFSGMDLPDYTDAVINYHFYRMEYEKPPASPPKSGNANYVLNWTVEEINSSGFDPSAATPTNKFVRKPYYGGYNFANVREGDIIYEPGSFTHTGIVMNTSKSSVDYGTFILTQDCLPAGVLYGLLDDMRMVDFRVIILRVIGSTNTSRATAVNFCNQQYGKGYSLDIFRLQTDINSTQWYCSELIYAAYNDAGIDIGVRIDMWGNYVYMTMGCLPGGHICEYQHI